MNFFTPVEDGAVLLKDRGTYHEAKLFLYGGTLFASYGRSHVRLLSHGSTSVARMGWVAIAFDTPGKTYDVEGGQLVIVKPPLAQKAA